MTHRKKQGKQEKRIGTRMDNPTTGTRFDIE